MHFNGTNPARATIEFSTAGLRTAAKFFLYLALMSVVVVVPGTFFPFIGVKYFFFRAMVSLALISLALWWGFDPEADAWLRRRFKDVFSRPLFLAVSVFVLMFLLASVAAYDPHGAFWSNFERGEGGFQMVHYYLFFTIMLLLLESDRDWHMFFKISLAAAALVVLYGFASNWYVEKGDGVFTNPFGLISPYRDGIERALNEDAPPQVTGFGREFWRRLFEGRFQGSLGNPAYVAPYLMFAAFYALWLWLKGRKVLRRNLGYWALIALFFFAFLLTQTRGAFLGLVAASGVFLIYLLFSGEKKLRRAALIAMAVLALTAAVLTGFREHPLVANAPISRLLYFDLKELTAQTRFWTWNSAWQGFLERPLLGWGPENFGTVFDKYFDPRHFVPGKATETWFDRAHSTVFGYLAETGLAGLLAFLAIFAVFFRGLWNKLRTGWLPDGNARTGRVLAGLLIAVPVGYFVQGLVLFDVLPIYVNLFAFFGFMSHLFHGAND